MKQEKTFIKTNIKTKSIILFLMFALFCIFGISACAEDLPTNSVDDSLNGNGNIINTNTNSGGDSSSTLNFPMDTYKDVYITPWVHRPYTIAAANRHRVSWQDTNDLTELWKDIIEGKHIFDGKRWAIRDVNIGNDTDSYYYFDNNLDIVHVYEKEMANGKYGHVVKVKQFLGGVIVRYSDGNGSDPRVQTVGGLYKTLLNKEKNNSQGKRGYTTYKYDSNLKNFMRDEHNREEGDLSIILMNVSFDNDYSEFGVDEYYCTIDDNYRKNPSYFIGKKPENYIGTTDDNYRWKNEKLNVRVNHWNNFRFFRL